MTDKATAGKGLQTRLVWTLETVQDRCDEVGDCWVWRMCLTTHGLPQARIDGRSRVVRIWIYDTLLAKKRPIRSVIRCNCDNRLCLNPAHLVHGTQADAVRASYTSGARSRIDMTLKRRENAIKQGLSKLSMEKAEEIRFKASLTSRRVLAEEYGVSIATVKGILSGRYWKPALTASVFDWRP